VIVAARTALELGAATGLLREASQLVEGVGPEDLSGERATLACPRGRAQRSARDDRT
jgi:hypothetical protein